MAFPPWNGELRREERRRICWAKVIQLRLLDFLIARQVSIVVFVDVLPKYGLAKTKPLLREIYLFLMWNILKTSALKIDHG